LEYLTVTKLVILKIGDGSFEQGFPVTLQIGAEQSLPTTVIEGRLPAAPELPGDYQRWQAQYKALDALFRLSAPAQQVTNVSLTDACQTLSDTLVKRLNAWIRTEEFDPIRSNWLKRLQPDEPMRIILQARDSRLQQLPWHLLDLLKGYDRAEIAVSASYDQPTQITSNRRQVKILAILGDSEGINTKADEALLQQLPHAQVTFLAEPERTELTAQLWQQPWDILFFAGHSASRQNYESGVIYLNKTDKLTLGELKYTLRKAVEQGLKLAIFNSCDGLGIARELADLQIPQIIAMREPVPDRVAQEFLKSFLAAFSQGESLYLAVRQAREQLEGWEHRFPCATWLPMIFQNLAVQPPTWQELTGQGQAGGGAPRRAGITWVQALGASLAATAAIVGIRHLGWLQALELKAFDQTLQMRSLIKPEKPDDRILVIEIDNDSVTEQERQQERLGNKSISDRYLIKLLDILAPHQPAAIGMDLQRDAQGVPPAVVKRLQAATSLVGICQGSYGKNPGFAPPAGIPADNIGFAETAVDPDQVIRRHLLFRDPEAGSPCQTDLSFSLLLALRYLAIRNVTAQFTPDLQLGKTPFTSLERLPGSYQQARQLKHLGGNQVLLNYRDMAAQPFAAISLSDVLRGRLSPEQIRDRVILLGVTHAKSTDMVLTPNGTKIPGVFVQAQMVSQIISAGLQERPLLRGWPEWAEMVWMGGWAVVGGMIIWCCPQPWLRRLGLTTAFVLLYATSLGGLTQGYWLPLVPAGLTLALTSGGLALYQASIKPSSLPALSAD
jgi:CHASE2 domain-containing sensor protein